MKEDLKKYAEGMGAKKDVLKWIDTHVPKDASQQEAEHVVDYLCSDKRPKRLSKASYEHMKQNTDKWVKAMNKKGAAIKELKKDTKVILDFEDGFKIVQLIGENAYKREGFLMRHCVAGYYGKDDEVYSLRDKKNMPHATFSGSSQQIKGKGNGCINPKYIKYVVEFLEYMKIGVRDSEMGNLGYVNVENIKDDNVDWGELFREKYFYKDSVSKLKDKEGNPYQSTLLWQEFGLLKDWKYQFNLNKSLKGTEKYIEKKQNHLDRSVNSGLGWSVNSGLDYSVNSGGNYSVNSGKDGSVNSGGNYSVNSGKDGSVNSGLSYPVNSGGNYSVNSGKDGSVNSGGNYPVNSGKDGSVNSGLRYSVNSGRDYSVNSGRDYSVNSGKDGSVNSGLGYSVNSGRDGSVNSGGNYSVNSGKDGSVNSGLGYSVIYLNGKSAIGVGYKGSIVQGVIGSAFTLPVVEGGEIIKMLSAVIDGERFKERTWYGVKDGRLAEVKPTEEQQKQIDKYEATRGLIDSLEDFYN